MNKRIFLLLIIFILLFILTPCIQAEGVYRVSLTGEVDPGMVNIVRDSLQEAEIAGAEMIIFSIDTYGGLVDSAIKIRDRILKTGIPTTTYVTGRAWSAGALIALAGERLVMVNGSSIGAAETRPKEEKYISALRKEFKATAEKRKRNPQVAAAMVDADIEIEGIIGKGKLLTLTAAEAGENNIADLLVTDFEDLLAELNLSQERVIQYSPDLTQKMARIVTRPAVSGLLLTIGFIALVLEAVIPGWGIGGTVGLLSLGLFFSGYIINGLASWGLVVLFIVGMVLIFLEIFVVPGFGVTGIGGLIAILFSLYFIFPTPQIALSVLAAVMVLSIIGTAIIVKIFGGSKFWKNISLGESQTTDSGYVAHSDARELEGKKGRTLTPLRPAGIADVEGNRLDVVSEGHFIDRDELIEIVKVSGSRIVVKKITEEDE